MTELFKLLGRITIEGVEKAKKDIEGVGKSAKSTAGDVDSSNKQITNSNKSSTSSWSTLKTKVDEYKANGMSTSDAWRKASADMKSSTEGASTGMVGAFKKIGLAIGTFLVVDKVIAFGQGCLQAAADVQAMESQFTQVFGELESKASKSLSGISKEAGISENRMKGSFTKIAAFAKTTGMDTESSLQLTERAMVAVADSAAFYDRSLEETTESLQSFLKGNYENDAALGLSCTEVTRNEAANRLYGKSFKDLSESQKQLTLLQMVEDANKLSGALGQASRESDTWTNVLGNLKQGWTDFQAVLGSAVLPVAIKVVKGLASAVGGLAEKTKNAIQWAKEHETTMKVVGIMFGALGVAIGGYNLALNWATITTKLYAAATKIAALATSGFASIMAFLTSPITIVILTIGALVSAVVVMYNKFDWFKNIVDRVKESMVNGWNNIKESVSGAIDSIKARLQPLVDAIQKNLVGAFNDMREKVDAAKEKLGELKEKFQPVIDIISGGFSSAVGSASDWLDKVKTKIGDLAEGALTKLNNGITNARDLFGKISTKVSELWGNLDPLVTLIRDNLVNSLKSMEEPLKSIWDSFKSVGETISNILMPALKDSFLPIWDALKPVLKAVAGLVAGELMVALGILSGILNGVASAIGGLVKAFSGIIEIVTNVFKLVVGVITGDGEAIKEAVKGIKDGIVKVFGGLWDAVKGFLKGFVDGVVGFFKGLWDTLVGHSIVPDIIDGIVGCFKGLWGKVKGLVSGFKDGVVKAFNTVKDKASSAFNSAKEKVISAASSMKEKATSSFNSMKDRASSSFNSMKDKISSSISSASNTVSEKFSSMKNKASSMSDSMKAKASSAFSSIKSSIASNMSGAYSTVSSKFGSIKDKISSVMESAKSIVSSAVSRLKSAFNFSWSLPKLKLPHISVKGGKAPYGIAGKGSLPSFSIKWYKKAYDDAMMLNNPTIFGYSAATGQYLGGGDGNGTEVVAGSDLLMKMIQNAVAIQNEPMIQYIQKIIQMLADFFPQMVDGLCGMNMVLDDGTLVGRLAPAMDVELGRLKGRKDRGR